MRDCFGAETFQGTPLKQPQHTCTSDMLVPPNPRHGQRYWASRSSCHFIP